MAVTRLDNPETYTPVYNEIIFVVDSHNNTQDNYEYVCDVYIDGVSTPAYVRLKQNPHPTTGYGTFDVSKVLEQYVTSDISTTTYGFQRNANSYVNFSCKFGEEYGLSSSGTTVYPNQSITGTFTAYNAIFDFLDFRNYVYTDYIASGTHEFMTNAPTTQSIRSDQNAWVHMLLSLPIVDYMQIITYDSSNNVLQTVNVDNGIGAFGIDDRTYRFGCGTKNLNLISSGSITSGAQPIITASVSKYTIQAFDNTNTSASALYTFELDDECTNHTVYRLHFLNKKGGFDSFNFYRASKFESEVKRSTYKRKTGSSSTGTYTYASSDRGDVVYATSIKDKLTLNSDWISEAESIWLEELVTSPEVYYDNGTDLIALTVVTSTHERRKTVNDKIFNMTIVCEYGHNRYRQRG